MPILLRQLGLFPTRFLAPNPLQQRLALATQMSTGTRCCKLDVLGWGRTCELLKVFSPFCSRSSLVPPNERLSCSKSWRGRILTCSVSYPRAPEPPSCRFLLILNCCLLQVLNWMCGLKLIVSTVDSGMLLRSWVGTQPPSGLTVLEVAFLPCCKTVCSR